MNDELDYDVYVLSEIAYKDKHNLESDESLFPENWYSSKNFKLKTEIIAEALDNDTTIEQTELYKQALLDGLLY